MVIDLTDVHIGKTNNWLIFEAYVGILDRNKKYKLEFCGTELNDYLSIPDELHEQLREKMAHDFQFGPYNLENVKEILKTHHSYVFR